MPVIEVYLPEGSIATERQPQLVAELTEVLLKWEGASGNPRALFGTFVYLHEVKAGTLAIGGKLQTASDPARYRVVVTVPFGTFTAERKQNLVTEISQTLIEAEGAAWNDLNRLRVLCLINEIAEGNWGGGRGILGLLDIARALGLEPNSPRYQELATAVAR